MLKIDYTLFIQIANFLLLLFLLNIFLYKPIRKILIQRSEEVKSFEGTIADFQAQAARFNKELEENASAANQEGLKEREKLKGEGLEGEKGLLREANTSSAEMIDQARKDINHKVAEARRSLETELESFSRELAQRVLGRSV